MSKPVEKATAGLRGAVWDPASLPPDGQFAVQVLRTEDGAVTHGVLARRGGEKCVVCLMHPREFLAAHYLVPEILRGGAAVWVQAPRSVGNDIRLEHETALLDVAAGVDWLRAQDYEKVVLLGNSGGAGLYSFYVQQSEASQGERVATTPGGKPAKLKDASLPSVDGVVFVSPHPGQGRLLMNCIDPSVVDEDDAFSIDPALFAFQKENGFRRPPQSSVYAPEFVLAYRAAQHARVERIDAKARKIISRRMEAKARLKEGGAPLDMVIGSHTPIFTVWRTDADLRCFDLSLDPSERAYGSLWGTNPFISNFGSVGFGRVCTADSWLSTWSGVSSNASLEKTAPAIKQPTLMIDYTGDNCVFPSDADEIYAAIGAADKERKKISGDHHGRPVKQGSENGQPLAGEAIRAWLAERFL